MTKKHNHDTYIAAAPEHFRAMLCQLRAQLSRALPDAEEVIKYDMPGFQIEETIIAGYAAFSKQCVYMLTRVRLLRMQTRSLL